MYIRADKIIFGFEIFFYSFNFYNKYLTFVSIYTKYVYKYISFIYMKSISKLFLYANKNFFFFFFCIVDQIKWNHLILLTLSIYWLYWLLYIMFNLTSYVSNNNFKINRTWNILVKLYTYNKNITLLLHDV